MNMRIPARCRQCDAEGYYVAGPGFEIPWCDDCLRAFMKGLFSAFGAIAAGWLFGKLVP